MSCDLSVEKDPAKDHPEEDALAVTTKIGNDDGLEANNDNDVSNDISHQPPQADLRDIQPLSKEYIGLPISYWNIGINDGIYSTMYPFLIVLHNVSSAFYTSAQQLVNLFWSYKLFYGIFYDAYYPPPSHNQKFKPWIGLGWTFNAIMLLVIAILGSKYSLTPSAFVVLLTITNFFEIVADTAMDGFNSWSTQHELKKQRGSMFTFNYQSQQSGYLFMNLISLFALSGPQANCPGFEQDTNEQCTTDSTITSRNSAYNNETDSSNWCHETCDAASFSFGLSVPHYYYILCGLVGLSLPFIFFYLKEEPKTKTTTCRKILKDLIRTSKRQAVWQILLYTLVLGTLFGVQNAAMTNANRVWLNLTTMQNTVIGIVDNLLFVITLHFIRTKGLTTFSWRKIMFLGKVFLLVVNLLYLLIVYDVTRNPWFYTVFSVSGEFSFILADIVGQFPSTEIAEPGLESMTYALITTVLNIARPLSAVISQQLLSFFPALADQDSIAKDTPSVRHQMMSLILVVEVINFSGLLVRSICRVEYSKRVSLAYDSLCSHNYCYCHFTFPFHSLFKGATDASTTERGDVSTGSRRENLYLLG